MRTLRQIFDEGTSGQMCFARKVRDTDHPNTVDLPTGTIVGLMCRRKETLLGLVIKGGVGTTYKMRDEVAVWEACDD